MASRLESTEMVAAAFTQFFTQERWRLEHKEPTAPLVISPVTGASLGVLQRQHTDWVAAARQSSPCYQHGPNLRESVVDPADTGWLLQCPPCHPT